MFKKKLSRRIFLGFHFGKRPPIVAVLKSQWFVLSNVLVLQVERSAETVTYHLKNCAKWSRAINRGYLCLKVVSLSHWGRKASLLNCFGLGCE